jgi:hypothetical protein
VEVYVNYCYFCGNLSEELKEYGLVEVVGGVTRHNIEHSMFRLLNHLMITEGRNVRLGAN